MAQLTGITYILGIYTTMAGAVWMHATDTLRREALVLFQEVIELPAFSLGRAAAAARPVSADHPSRDKLRFLLFRGDVSDVAADQRCPDPSPGNGGNSVGVSNRWFPDSDDCARGNQGRRLGRMTADYDPSFPAFLGGYTA